MNLDLPTNAIVVDDTIGLFVYSNKFKENIRSSSDNGHVELSPCWFLVIIDFLAEICEPFLLLLGALYR